MPLERGIQKVMNLRYQIRSGIHKGGIRDKGVKESIAILEAYDKISKKQKKLMDSAHVVGN